MNIENNKYIEKLKQLNNKIQTEITIEEFLNIMDIKLDSQSLTKILETINKFKNRLNEEKSNIIKQQKSDKIKVDMFYFFL